MWIPACSPTWWPGLSVCRSICTCSTATLCLASPCGIMVDVVHVPCPLRQNSVIAATDVHLPLPYNVIEHVAVRQHATSCLLRLDACTGIHLNADALHAPGQYIGYDSLPAGVDGVRLISKWSDCDYVKSSLPRLTIFLNHVQTKQR